MSLTIQALTEQLISIPSVSSDFQQCKKAIDFVEKLFDDTSYTIQRFEQNEVYSLIISRKQELDFDLLFFGHLDVVPGKDELFQPKVKENWIYGRGAADMKGACAAMIRLFLDVEHLENMQSCALVLTTDEEVGGDNGIGFLTREKELRAGTVFNPDGGAVLQPSLSQKGMFQFRLEAQGKSAHGSRPWQGSSAVALLLEDWNRIYSCFELASESEQNKVSLNLGRIEGGKAANSVPENAYALIDLRFPPTYSLSEIESMIAACLRHSTLTRLTSGDPVHVTESDRSYGILQSILREQGYEPTGVHNNTGSDARWFSEQGSSILLMLPKSTNGHIDEEAADIDGLNELHLIMQSFVQRFYQ